MFDKTQVLAAAINSLCWLASVLPAAAEVSLAPLITGLNQPVYVTDAGDNSGRLFVVEKDGLVRVYKNGALLPEPFLDLQKQVSRGMEQGLLTLKFHPQYSANGRAFVNYTARSGDTEIVEYKAESANPDRLDPGSRKLILSVQQPYSNHNGGGLEFGPDGYLYIGMGDGGAGDAHGNAQNMQSLLGKMLRIDIDRGAPYTVPADNPWAESKTAAKEIWAYGLRNPWRYSFDASNGRLFAGDVGQNTIEEIDLILRGKNYGWNMFEGTRCFKSGCKSAGTELPIAEYSRDEGISVTGGYVYRGKNIPELNGKYIFGDFGSGTIWALTEIAPGRWKRDVLLKTGVQISSFGIDQQLELYVADFKGTIFVLKNSIKQ